MPKLYEKIAKALGMPGELLPGTPLVWIMGSERVRVENHRGIADFSPRLLRLRWAGGEVIIRGEGLCVAELDGDELICRGKIASVELKDHGK